MGEYSFCEFPVQANGSSIDEAPVCSSFAADELISLGLRLTSKKFRLDVRAHQHPRLLFTAFSYRHRLCRRPKYLSMGGGLRLSDVD